MRHPAAHARLCEQAPSCSLYEFPGARHELMMETDDIRTPAMLTIADAISEGFGL